MPGRMQSVLKNPHLVAAGPHDLRQSYVSLQRQAGTRMEVISANLGRANSNITRAVYLDVFAEDRQESAAAMDAILARGRAERASF